MRVSWQQAGHDLAAVAAVEIEIGIGGQTRMINGAGGVVDLLEEALPPLPVAQGRDFANSIQGKTERWHICGVCVIAFGMKTFDEDLAARLIDLRAQGLYRELRRVDSPQSSRIVINGQTLLNFSSNDYLGLADDPALKAAAAAAVEKYGAGSGASRLICGSLAPHHELEEALADFKGTPAALTFSSGYATAVGTICALLDSNDVILADKLVHACIVDAAAIRENLSVYT